MYKYLNFDVFNNTPQNIDCTAAIESNQAILSSKERYEMSVVRAQIPLSRIPICSSSFLELCALSVGGHEFIVPLEPLKLDVFREDLVIALNTAVVKSAQLAGQTADESFAFHISSEGLVTCQRNDATNPDPVTFEVNARLLPLFGVLDHYPSVYPGLTHVTDRGDARPSSLMTFAEYDRINVMTDMPIHPEICVNNSGDGSYSQKILTDYSLLQVTDFSSYALIVPVLERWISVYPSNDINSVSMRVHLRSKNGSDRILTIAPSMNASLKICVRTLV